MKLVFSAPVPWETARQILLISQAGKIWKPKSGGDEKKQWVDQVIFEGPFPENTSFTLHLPKNLKDDAGRPLSNQDKFPLKIKTDRYPSLAKFSARFGIIEWNEGGILPLTVRNLEAEIKAWMTVAEDKQVGPEKKTPDPALKAGKSVRTITPETSQSVPHQLTQSLKGKHPSPRNG